MSPLHRSAGPAIRTVRAYLGLLLAAHILLVLSFPRPGWAVLAHVALVPAAILAVRAASARRLAWTCFLLSFAWWVYMIRWLVPVTGGGYLGLAAYMATYAVGSLLLVRWLGGRFRLPLTVLLPMSWVSLELLRGLVLAGGFGWYALAHSQAPWRVGQAPGRIIQVADLFGEYGVSFLVAMTNGLLCDLYFCLRRGGGGLRRGRFKLSVALWLSVYIGAWIYGNFRLTQLPNASPSTVRVAVVQTNIPQDNKVRPTPETDDEMWSQLQRLTLEAASAHPAPDLIVWPESSTPAPINTSAAQRFAEESRGWRDITVGWMTASEHAELFRAMAQQRRIDLADLPQALEAEYGKRAAYGGLIGDLARQIQTPIVVGSLTRQDGRPTLSYNSVYLYGGDGARSADRYDKTHLVPFGEFIPWVESWPRLRDWFIRVLTPYDDDYTLARGVALTVFRLGVSASDGDASPRDDGSGQLDADEATALRFATPICFEDTVSRVIRRMVYDQGRKRVDLLVNVTNDGWFTGSMQPVHHMQAAGLRCVENRLPMARSVNTGPSGFIDSTGRIGPLVVSSGRSQDCEGVAVHEVALDSRHTFYGRWGTIPMFLVLIATGTLAVRGCWVRRG